MPYNFEGLTTKEPASQYSFAGLTKPTGPETEDSSFLKGVGSSVARSAGVALGALNAPLAFGWGGAAAGLTEEYRNAPWYERPLIAFKGAFKSAGESIAEPGSFGTTYGEYYSNVRGGKTIHDDIVSGLGAEKDLAAGNENKYAAKMVAADVLAPLAEILGDIVSDPLILPLEALNLAKLNFKKVAPLPSKIDPKLADAVFKAEKLEGEQRKALQDHLLSVLKERQTRLDFDEALQKHVSSVYEYNRSRGPGLMKPGGREIPGLTAPRQAVAGQPKREFAAIQDALPEDVILGRKLMTEEEKLFSDQLATVREGKSAVTGALEAESKIGEPLIQRGPGYEKSARPLSVKSLSKDPTTARASGGAILGIEEDENGNLQYNIGKGLAGTLGVTAGIKYAGKANKLKETLAKYPALKKIHESVGKKREAFDFSGLIPRLVESFRDRFTDRFAALEKTSPATYVEASTFRSHADVSYQKFMELADSMQPVKKDEVWVTNYLTAHRDVTRAERGIRNPGDVTLTEAKEAISNIEEIWTQSGKNLDDLHTARDDFQAWTHDNILKPLLEGGIINQASYNEIVKNNQWYVAFDVLDRMDEAGKLPSGFTSAEWFSTPTQKVVKSLKGTTKQIDNPIDSTIRKFTEAQGTIAKNGVASTLIDDPGMAELIQPVAESAKQFKILQNMGQNPVTSGSIPKGYDTISRFKDGRVEKYAVPKNIATAMKQLTPWQAPKVVQMYHTVFRGAATTFRVAFMLGNVPRDALMAYVSSPVYRARDVAGKFQADWINGAWEASKEEFPWLTKKFGKSETVEQYIKDGGGFGYAGAEAFDSAGRKLPRTALFEKSGFRKAATVVVSPATLVKKLNSITELAPRLGIYERAKKVGYFDDEAAMLGRRGTIDFNKGGRWVKAANQWVPFLNARVQARTVLANALRTDTKNTLAKASVAIIPPAVTAYAFNNIYFKDLYEDVPEYIKKDYFIMIYGSEENDKGKTVPKMIALAKGDIGQMLANPLELMLDKMFSERPKDTKKFLMDFINDLSPVDAVRDGELSGTKLASSLLPPGGKAVGTMTGAIEKNLYTGYDTIPRSLQDDPPELQVKENTPWLHKKIGAALGVSPLKVQSVMSDVLAGYGREGLSPKAMLDGITGKVFKVKGGAIEREAVEYIDDNIKKGYSTAKSYAENAVAAGDISEAITLMNKWNQGISEGIAEYNKLYRKYGFQNRGKLQKDHTFTLQKRKNILKGKKVKQSYLERQL